MSAINETVLWAAVADRIGFYSKETAHQIPSIPGVYAWFLPLWLYRDKPDGFVETVQAVLRGDERQAGGGMGAKVEDHWETIDIRLRRLARCDVTEQFKQTWRAVQNDP